MAAYVPIPIIQKEAWAQCENPNCEKWRKLPPGTVVNENEPWYCYMNPDLERNTCSADEVDYDENNEIVIADTADTEEAARNARIMQELEASIAAAAAAGNRGRGRGKPRGRGQARGRGRPPIAGRGGAFAIPAAVPYDYYAATKRNRNVSFAGDDDQLDSDMSPGAGRHSRINRKQISKNLQRIIENQGQWDAARGTAASQLLPGSMPSEAWEALTLAAPDEATVACHAADLASSMRYFEGTAGTDQQDLLQEVGVVSRLAVMMAAASGLVETRDALTQIEKDRFGVGHSGVLPHPEVPLSEVVDGGAGAVDTLNIE